MEHVCCNSKTCTCNKLALEPNEDCPVHGIGIFPPKCEKCGCFMKWKDGYEK